MSNRSDQQTPTKLELMSSEAITEYINNQRAVLIRNLAYQRKYLTALVQERETELKTLSNMSVTKGLLKNGDDIIIRAEIMILRRRLLMLESKETELRKVQVKPSAKPLQDERQLVRNYSRKIIKDASGSVWIWASHKCRKKGMWCAQSIARWGDEVGD